MAAVSFQLLFPLSAAWSASAAEWPKTFPKYHVFSTKFADLDKDGQKEVIVELTPSMIGLNKPVPEYAHLEAYRADGRLLWISDSLKPYVSLPDSAFAVGEVDGDGYPEIVLGMQAPPAGDTHSAVFVLDHNGKIKQGWPVLFSQPAVGQPLLADLDKDGNCEIIFSHPLDKSKEDAVSAYKGNGSPLWTRPSPPNRAVRGVAVGDIDNDGRGQEIVLSFDGKISLLNANGSDFGTILIPAPRKPSVPPRLSSPVLGDLDGDGDLEIVVCSAETNGTIQMHAFRHDGTTIPGFPKEAGPFSVVLPSPILADIDADKTLEIFAFTEGAIYGWDSTGAQLRGWPVTLSWDLRNPKFLAVTNVNGNKAMEILFTSKDSILQSLNADGSPTAKYPTRLDPKGFTAYQAVFGDLGIDDHKLYMAASTTNKQYLDGKAFLVKMDVSYNSKKKDWPMAGHDLQLTGRAGLFTNPPVFSPALPASVKINRGSLFTYQISAKDLDGDTLTYAAEGLPSGASFDRANHTIRWTPKIRQSGTYSIVLSVSDGISTSKEKLDLVVRPENMVLVESEAASQSQKTVVAAKPKNTAVAPVLMPLPKPAATVPTVIVPATAPQASKLIAVSTVSKASQDMIAPPRVLSMAAPSATKTLLASSRDSGVRPNPTANFVGRYVSKSAEAAFREKEAITR